MSKGLLRCCVLLTACGQVAIEDVPRGAPSPDAGVLEDLGRDRNMPDMQVEDRGSDLAQDSGAGCADWAPGAFTFDVVGVVETGDITAERGEFRLRRDGSALLFGSGGDVYEAARVSETRFAPARAIAGLDGDDETFGADLAPDGLRALVMVAGGATQTDIWWYARSSTSDPFAPERAMDALNTAGHDWDPRMSRDGRFLVSARVNDAESEILLSERPDLGSEFAIAETLLRDARTLGNPSLSADRRILVLNVSDVGSHIHYATRGSEGFGELRPLPGIAERTETEPFLTEDGCTLYYTAQSDTDGYRMLLARYRRL